MIYREKFGYFAFGQIMLLLMFVLLMTLSFTGTTSLLNYKDTYNLGYPYGLLAWTIFNYILLFGLVILYLYGRKNQPLMIVSVEIEGKQIALTYRDGSKIVLPNITRLVHTSYHGTDGLLLFDQDKKKYSIPFLLFGNNKKLKSDIESVTGKKFEHVCGLDVINY